MKRIYVASRYGNMEEAKKVQKFFKVLGCFITFDWTDPDFDLPSFVKNGMGELVAAADFVGVQSCDAVVALVEKQGGCGMWAEIGIALGLGKQVILIPGQHDITTLEILNRNIFNHMCHILTDAPDAARFLGLKPHAGHDLY